MRNTRGMVSLCQQHSIVQFVFNAERTERLLKILGIDAVRDEEIASLIECVERIPINVYFLKDERMQLLEFAERLGGVVKTAMKARDLVPGGRYSHKRNIGCLAVRRCSLAPILKCRIESIAMRTAIPKYFGDFDLVRRNVNRLRRR